MPSYNLLLLPGDGIGLEVMAEVKKLIGWMNSHGMGGFNTEEGLCGGCAYDASGGAVTDETVEKAKSADAVRSADSNATTATIAADAMNTRTFSILAVDLPGASSRF